MKLKYRLFGSYLAIITLALISCLLTWNGYRTVHTRLVATTQDILPGQQAMMSAKQSALATIVESRDYLRSGDEIHVQYARENMDDLRESLHTHLEHATHVGEQEKSVAEEMERRGLHLIKLCNGLIDSHQRGASEETLSESREEICLCKAELFEMLDQHLAVHEQELLDAQNGIYQTITSGSRIFSATGILLLALGLFIALYTAKSILEPIHELETGAEIIGGGDLDFRLDIKTGDEIEQLAAAFNGMADQLANMMDTLEQRVAERTRDLSASEKRFRDVAENMADWIWEVDGAGRYTYCSEGVVALLGYTPEEMLGQTPFEFVPPGEAARVGEVFAGIAANEHPVVDLENRYLTKDGREVVLLTNGVPILDSEGNLLGYRGVDKDITERKRAEEALRESEERYRSLFESVPVGLYRSAPTGQLLDANPTILRMLDYPDRESLLAVNADDIYVNVKDRQRWQALMERDGFVRDYEQQFHRRDGTVIWVEDNAQAIRNQDGSILYYEGSLKDITERKRVEEALSEQKSLLDEIFNGVQEGIGIVDENETIIFCNPAYADIFEQKKDYLVGKSLLSFFDAEVRSMILQQTKVRQTGQISTYELALVTAKGNRKHIRVTVSPRFGEDGSYAGAFGIVLDITERKRAEEEVQRRATQAALIYEVGQRVSGELELDALLSGIVTAVCDAFGYYSAMLMLLDEKAERLTLQSIAGGYAGVFPQDLSIAVGEGIIGYAALTGETQVSGDVIQNPHYVRKAQEETRSELAVPIESGQQVIGVLNLQGHEFEAFDETDVVAMETLSTQIATAIENARLLQDTRTHVEELAVLNELGQALTTRLDVEQVLDETYRGASRLMDTSNFYIALHNPDKEEEITFALDVVEGEVQEPYVTRPAGRGLAEYVIHNRTPLLIEADLPERLKEMGIELAGRAALSWVGVPLVVGDRVLGMMAAVQGHTTSRAYDEHDRDLLLSIANQTAIALQNAYLFEETRRRAAQLALINDVGGKIAAVLELDSVLDRAAHLVQESFGYHHVALFTVDRERDEMVMRTRAGDFAPLFPRDHRLKLGQGMVGWVSLHGEALLANDVETEPRYVNLYPDVIPTRSELSVPIRVSQEVMGVLDVQSPRRDAFDENDVMVIETLADQVAVAIDNARLYEAVQRELVERVRAEEALAQSVSLLQATLESTADGILVIDIVGKIVNFNQRFTEMWRIPDDVIASQDDDQALAFVLDQLSDPNEFITKVKELYSRPEAESFDVLHFKDDRIFERHSQPQRIEDKVVGRVWSFHDVTERKRAEEALERQAEELARSNTELEQFAYIASHDLREPLRMVTSYLQLLQRRYKGQLNTDADEFIEFAVDGATRMRALINDLLTYSRVSTRAKPFEPTDCCAVLDHTLANLKIAIKENDAVVTCDDLPTVMADKVQLTQVFQNLVGNGIKFRSDRPPKVHVGVERNDGEWLFSVRDNGIGIDPQYFERIFLVFQRLHGRSEYPGTGIGLAVCRKVVERHGGRMWVESEPGQGSTFYFTIPGGRLVE